MKTRNQKLAAALAYAARGWAVLPLHHITERACSCGKRDCPNAGKHPRTRHGLCDATNDVASVRAFWQRWPRANVGIVTGKGSGLIVIDIDPRNGGVDSWQKQLREHELPPTTIEAVTGGGGRHLYFAHPGGHQRSGSNKLGTGVDIKADGGYVVAPPSRHVSGSQYAWKAGCDPSALDLAACPAWISAVAQQYPSAPPTSARENGSFIEGERNSELARLAGTMRRNGFTREAIEAALQLHNDQRCIPPLLAAEVRRIASSISQYDPATRAMAKVVSRRLSRVKAEKVRWLWRDRVPVGKVTMLVGDPGLGKSFVTLDIAARVSTGRPWPNGSTRHTPRSVLLLSAEDDAADTIRPRLEAMKADLTRIAIIDGVKSRGAEGERHFSLERDLNALRREIKRRRHVRLIVIDPITAYLGASTDSHKNADVRAVLAPLSKLASHHGVAIVCVSHLNKAAGTKMIYRTSGSLAFIAAARAGWLVAVDPRDGNRRVMVQMKNNLARDPGGLGFRIADGRIKWARDRVKLTADEVVAAEQAGSEHPSEREDAKSWLLTLLDDGPVRATEVWKQAKENRISERTLKRAKSELQIQPTREGGIAAQGAWWWSLPPAKGAKSAKRAKPRG